MGHLKIERISRAVGHEGRDIPDNHFVLFGVLADQAANGFVEDYEATQPECFGIVLAHYFEWNGDQIAQAAYAALEDANFHTLAAKFKEAAEADGLNMEIEA